MLLRSQGQYLSLGGGMKIPLDSFCGHCQKKFNVGEQIYVTYSDADGKDYYFHTICWRKNWQKHLDCVPTGNRKEFPS